MPVGVDTVTTSPTASWRSSAAGWECSIESWRGAGGGGSIVITGLEDGDDARRRAPTPAQDVVQEQVCCCELSPQHHAFALVSIAHVVASLADTVVHVTPAGVSTGVGNVRVAVSPVPRLPTLLAPQHQMLRPPKVTAHA